MKKIIIFIVADIILIAIAFALIIHSSFNKELEAKYTGPSFTIQEEMKTADAELGKRMYFVRNGCVECHGKDLAGAPIMDNGAMGKIAGPNITPYKTKDMTDEQIAMVIRYGIKKDGHSVKFMPVFDYEGLSKQDIASLIKYMRSVPAVEKPDAPISFGPVAKAMTVFGNIPVVLPARNTNMNAGFAGKPAEAPNAEFGKYLAFGCIGCHGTEFKGGKIPGGDPSWPEAKNIRFGSNLKVWTLEAFKKFAATGVSPTTNETVRMPMPATMFKEMNETEVTALYKYLASLN